MPKLEPLPSQEGRGGNGRGDSDDEDERNIPPLSDFNSDRNLVQWRFDALHHSLHGTPKDPSSPHGWMLNGSQSFQRVYGSGEEAIPFRDSVGETFEFVTNVTTYNHQGGDSGNVSDPQGGGGGEGARTDTSMTNADWLRQLSTEDDGEDDSAFVLPDRANSAIARGTEFIPRLAEQSRPTAMAGADVGGVELPALPALALWPRQGSSGGATEDGREDGRELLLPPPAVPSFIPVVTPLRGRRHLSV
ncbi:hypothetical protein ACOMHN_065791 [Nucella lapillus]